MKRFQGAEGTLSEKLNPLRPPLFRKFTLPSIYSAYSARKPNPLLDLNLKTLYVLKFFGRSPEVCDNEQTNRLLGNTYDDNETEDSRYGLEGGEQCP